MVKTDYRKDWKLQFDDGNRSLTQIEDGNLPHLNTSASAPIEGWTSEPRSQKNQLDNYPLSKETKECGD